jgi:LPXTG-motif cell wall-anchored protein
MMKKSVLVFSMTSLLLLGGMNMAIAQDQPKPKKDTVNIDSDAKPTFYYAVEDDSKPVTGKSSGVMIAIIVGGIAVLGVAGYFIMKKMKK